MARSFNIIYSAMLCVALSCSLLCRSALGQDDNLEYEVKSACIYNFLKFIEFPQPLSGKSDQTITVCIVGKGAAGEIISKILSGQQVGEKRIEIMLFPEIAQLLAKGKKYHVVFLAALNEGDFNDHVSSLRKAAILTIGETPGFCQKGGIINFHAENGKLRFDVNVKAAENANLKISSQLLKLANIVEQPSAEEQGNVRK